MYLGHGAMAPLRLPKRIKTKMVEKDPKANLSFDGVLRAWGAGAHAGFIANLYSLAHAR